jgi:hypothetical protein
MTRPARYTKGVNNADTRTTLSEYVAMDPTKVITFFDDFHTYVATDFVTTATSAGSGTSVAICSDTYIGGGLLITNADNEDDSLWSQQSHDGGTNDAEVYRIQGGKKAWFKCKFQGSDVDQTDYIVGIHNVAADPIDTAPTDGVWFQSDDADGYIDFHSVKNSVYTTSSAIATMTDATDIIVGFYWDGVNTFELYIDDALVGSMTSATIPNDEYMAISFGCQNGEAVANTMTIDYIFAAVER